MPRHLCSAAVAFQDVHRRERNALSCRISSDLSPGQRASTSRPQEEERVWPTAYQLGVRSPGSHGSRCRYMTDACAVEGLLRAYHLRCNMLHSLAHVRASRHALCVAGMRRSPAASSSGGGDVLQDTVRTSDKWPQADNGPQAKRAPRYTEQTD